MIKIREITSFVRLDFYLLKPYKKSFLWLLAIAVSMTVGFQNLVTLYSYLIFCLIMIMMYPFSIGEANRTESLYATLPLKRGSVVVGRYVFALCLEFAAILLSLVISLIMSALFNLELVPSEILLYICIMPSVVSALVAVQYPFYFKLGYNKAKFIAYVPVLLVFLAFILLPNLLKSLNLDIEYGDFIKLIESYPVLAYILPVAAGLILLAASCLVSRRMYEKRDL